jgi:hypothetical protein
VGEAVKVVVRRDAASTSEEALITFARELLAGLSKCQIRAPYWEGANRQIG